MNKQHQATSDVEIEFNDTALSFYIAQANKNKTTPEKLMSLIVQQYMKKRAGE